MRWQRFVSFNRTIIVSSSRMDVNPSVGKKSVPSPFFAPRYCNKMRIGMSLNPTVNGKEVARDTDVVGLSYAHVYSDPFNVYLG